MAQALRERRRSGQLHHRDWDHHSQLREKLPLRAAVENVTTVHDLHATMLHLLGIRHDTFTFKFQGLDARLSGVEPARVLTGILA